jgi:predicted RNA-binding Zn-ribbon protein involved in translation (DUF1610 family)
MLVIETMVEKRRLKASTGKPRTVQSERTKGYICPKCGSLISYIPVRSIRQCVNCNVDIEWN